MNTLVLATDVSAVDRTNWACAIINKHVNLQRRFCRQVEGTFCTDNVCDQVYGPS